MKPLPFLVFGVGVGLVGLRGVVVAYEAPAPVPAPDTPAVAEAAPDTASDTAADATLARRRDVRAPLQAPGASGSPASSRTPPPPGRPDIRPPLQGDDAGFSFADLHDEGYAMPESRGDGFTVPTGMKEMDPLDGRAY